MLHDYQVCAAGRFWVNINTSSLPAEPEDGDIEETFQNGQMPF
jgi:hypothetical protein